ncbi:hypothetical protein ACFTTN_31680 [Streptomyces niveus]|uniref:hypothetical protein n=1 Tax=Streptomyces niveus TaxID=193462 RepID=UPI00363B60DE
MINGMMGRAVGALDPRFVLTLLMPVLVFWSGVAALFTKSSHWAGWAGHWNDLAGLQQVLVVTATTGVLILFATIVGHHVIPIMRIFEGYWGRNRLAEAANRLATGFQQSRWRRIRNNPDQYTRRYQQFPVRETDLRPTRFGNVVRAAETYATDERRYGMDAVFFWPRLLAVMPDGTRALLANARAGMELMVITSALATVLTVASLILGPLMNVPASTWLSTAIAAALVARITYTAAVRSADTYGELVRTSFDLYRRDLLRSMGFKPPQDLPAERALWKAIGQQLYRRGADNEELLVFGD